MVDIHSAFNLLNKCKHCIVYLGAWSFCIVLQICNYYSRIIFQETEMSSQRAWTFLTQQCTYCLTALPKSCASLLFAAQVETALLTYPSSLWTRYFAVKTDEDANPMHSLQCLHRKGMRLCSCGESQNGWARKGKCAGDVPKRACGWGSALVEGLL